MSQTNGEKGIHRRSANNAKVNSKPKHRVRVLNGAVVGILGVGKLSVGGKVTSNRGVLAGLVSEVCSVFCCPVPVAVVGLIAGF